MNGRLMGMAFALTIALFVGGIAIIFSTGGMSISDTRKAELLLNTQGFTDVTFEGPAPWRCGDGDTFSRSFTATAKDGAPISGTICEGLLKGSTIRFN
jgi:hypothetical protein